VLLRVGDHLVQGQDEIAGALGEAALRRQVADRRTDLGDLRRIVTERRRVALVLLRICSAPRDLPMPPRCRDFTGTVAIRSDPAGNPGETRNRLADRSLFG
jgi:hypothetical protein